MDSPNVDLARAISAEWERGDFSSTWWADPEIEYVGGDGPAPGTFLGLAAMASGFGDFLRAWERIRIEPLEYRELDDERVLVLVRFNARGRTSGLELADTRAHGASLFHIHGGKVTKLVTYFDGQRALAELGL